ncbi:MAG: hypothetical protein ACRC1T_05405 [Clostridium chrysemydis]|uniref:hypothetical protein n=1 Tax=Clostridium chrysemydis TaxID=2665504 RepID=UPI003F40A5B5
MDKPTRVKRRNMRILDDPEGFFKDMSNEELIKLLDEMGFNYEIKDGVEVENKQQHKTMYYLWWYRFRI